jgi:hypothetical protein
MEYLTIENLHELLVEKKSEARKIQKQIAESNSLQDLHKLSKQLQETIESINYYGHEIEQFSGTEQTLSLCDIDRKSAYKYINKKVRLTRDILSWNCERVIKRKGSEGTIESLHSMYNQAIVKMGKRNYDINFSDFEVIL